MIGGKRWRRYESSAIASAYPQPRFPAIPLVILTKPRRDCVTAVPQSGIYTITHDPAHADMPHEVTVIKGRRFPTCRHCKGISFELAHAARHVGEIDHLEEAHAPAS